ncbi:MAG TPA: S-layer homology domain-containing protein [Bacillota bacterium]|nr:S-layer homology domain-containing protein [Bacillota bacterium]
MNYRKGISAVLTAVLVISAGVSVSYGSNSAGAIAEAGATAATEAGVTATTGAAFSDISGHWAESIIKEAADLGIVGGYPDGTFLPDNLIKREEFYKLLSNILTEKPDTTNTKIKFTDVVDYEWYVPTIKIAVASGITSGYDDGTFGIGRMISRQEAAKVAGSVIPAAGTEGKKGVETALDKSDIADWAYAYVDLMFKKGYMQGDTEGKFRPTTALTRAEAATILLNIKKNEPVIAPTGAIVSPPDTETPAAVSVAPGCLEHPEEKGAFLEGSGTQADPYEISTEEQLNHMRMHATEGAFYVLKKNIAITKDYTVTPTAVTAADASEPDWSEGNFAPIGSEKVPFKGSLFGNGYTISGMNISGTVGKGKTAAGYAGLFGYLAKGSSVTDVIVDGSNISGSQYTGGIAGYNEGTIKDCQLGEQGIINGQRYTGGLVGYSTQPLNSLRSRGTVKGSQSNTGGIVGYIDASEKALLYCQNEGKVTGEDTAGGIAGTIAEGTAEKCVNSGEVRGSGVNGGIAGTLDSKAAAVTDCINDGDVEGNGAGGIAGINRGKISYGYNSGAVDAKQDGGGIAAHQSGDGVISKSYNEGAVSSNDTAGGIAGENNAYIENSYNAGKVKGDRLSGGIAGLNAGTAENIYNAGKVRGDTTAGSLAGRNSGYLTNAYWLDTTADSGAGLEDNKNHEKDVRKVTDEELSGQRKVSATSGYAMLIDLMNSNNATPSDKNPEAVWEYTYKILVPAPSNNTVVSDGGSIVPPLTMPSTDNTGNTIDPSDLKTEYLYPRIIN